MDKSLWGSLLVAAMLCLGPAPVIAADYKIVTASERGTYIKIGRDLAQFVAPPADIRLEAVPSPGSAENVRLLRNEPGVKLALVQSDVYQSFLDIAASGNLAARALILQALTLPLLWIGQRAIGRDFMLRRTAT